MLTIIHGDDIAKSRAFYLSEREKHPEKVILDGAMLTLTDFSQAASGSGLFGDQQTIFIEELFSKRKPSKELDALASQISLITSTPIFLWESKELTPKQLKQLGKAELRHFSLPKTVFAFIDSIFPGNGKKSVSLFHELLIHEDANFALFMLQRQVRILLALQDKNSSENISEVTRLAPWQKGKLEKQAKAFSQTTLLQLHDQLFQIDLGQKTGQLSRPLDQAIDFFLLSL